MKNDDVPAVTATGQVIQNNVLHGIRSASDKTGGDFAFLMLQAGRESNFQPGASATRSSAAGLFQFTTGTWLQMVKQHGPKHGLAELASHIVPGRGHGELTVDDPDMRKIILDLRRDPRVSALMASEYAADNRKVLEDRLGREVDATDLTLAHLLGAGGAAKFLEVRESQGDKAAAKVVPAAARNNPSIFYDHGKPRTVAAVYARVRDSVAAPLASYTRLAAATPSEPAAAATPHPHPHRAKPSPLAQIPPPRPKPEAPPIPDLVPPATLVADAGPPAPALPAPPFPPPAFPPPAFPPSPDTPARDTAERLDPLDVTALASAETGDGKATVSRPMPPSPHRAGEAPVVRLLRSLFG